MFVVSDLTYRRSRGAARALIVCRFSLWQCDSYDVASPEAGPVNPGRIYHYFLSSHGARLPHQAFAQHHIQCSAHRLENSTIIALNTSGQSSPNLWTLFIIAVNWAQYELEA